MIVVEYGMNTGILIYLGFYLVSLLILARENDFSLDLSSPAVQAVVRVLEQSTPLERECLELDGAENGSESEEEDVKIEASSYLGKSYLVIVIVIVI